MDREYFSREEI
jgi:histone H3/H4